MRMIDAQQVHTLLDYPGLIEGLRQGHLQHIDEAGSLLLSDESAPATKHFLVLPAWQHDRAMGVKLVTVFPDNLHNEATLPSVQAVYILFDARNGEPIACIDGTALTYRKTAADSGLGSTLLSRTDSRAMVMVGAGGLAPHVIQAHIAARPSIDRVQIWNRTHARAEAVAEQLEIPGVDISATTDLEAAVRQADVISCATNATEPLVMGAWLQPGSHLDLIGSYTTDMHEADEDALVRASVFGDSHTRMLEDSGEIADALASGALTASDIVGDLFDLAQGRCRGRESADEITLFKNAGGGHLDLMTARYLIDQLQ